MLSNAPSAVNILLSVPLVAHHITYFKVRGLVSLLVPSVTFKTTTFVKVFLD